MEIEKNIEQCVQSSESIRKGKLRLIQMSEVEEKEVMWLWYPYIPYGKITIIQGDPGEGKTTFVLQLSALLSKGEKLPCDESERESINIIYQSAEDGLEDTIKPRLMKAGADCRKILVIDEQEKALTMTDERLEEAIIETGAKLIIFDPIQAYIGADLDMHRANETRPVLKQLGMIADKYECAIILIGHMNKASGVKSTYRGLGSIDLQATARSVLMVGRIKDNPNMRVIAHDKSSLAVEGKAIGFSLSEEKGFEWVGQLDITVDELLAGGKTETKMFKAKKMLNDLLEEEEKLQSEIMEQAIEMNISKRLLDQVKKNMGISSKRKGGQWYWYLKK